MTPDFIGDDLEFVDSRGRTIMRERADGTLEVDERFGVVNTPGTQEDDPDGKNETRVGLTVDEQGRRKYKVLDETEGKLIEDKQPERSADRGKHPGIVFDPSEIRRPSGENV